MMMHKNLSALTGLGLIALCLPTLATAAPLESALDVSCWQTLNQVKAEIGTIVDQPTFNTSAYDMQQEYSATPKGRPLVLNIGVGGPERGVNTSTYWQVSNFMASPALQTALANQLIQNCHNIAAVGFGMASTDWRNLYGVTSDAKVMPFYPISPPCRRLSWGEYCQP